MTETTPNEAPRAGRAAGALELVYPFALLLAVIGTALARLPPGTLFSAAPPALHNYAKYVYFIDRHIELLRQEWSFWAYDPTFGGGYLTNSGWMVPYLFQSVLGWLTGLSGAMLVKLFFAAYFLAAPWLLYLAARWFGLARLEASLAGLIGLVFDNASLSTNFLMGGLLNSYFACALILPTAAAIVRLNRDRRRLVATHLVIVAGGLLAGSINPTVLLPMSLVLAVVWLRRRRLFLNPAGAAAGLLSCLAIVAGLWSWAKPGWDFLPAIGEYYSFYRFLRLEWTWMHGWLAILYLFHPLALVLMVYGAAQIVRWRRQQQPLGDLLAISAGAVMLLVIAVIAAGQGPNLFPIRFLVVPLFCLALPAAALLGKNLRALETNPPLTAAVHLAFWGTAFIPAFLYFFLLAAAALQIVRWWKGHKIPSVIFGFILFVLALMLMTILTAEGGPDYLRFQFGPFYMSVAMVVPCLGTIGAFFLARGKRRLLPVAFALFMAVTLTHNLANFVSTHRYHHPLWPSRLTTTDDQPAFLELVDLLQAKTSGEARILVENTHNLDNMAFGFDIVGLLPQLLPDREWVAVPDSESAGLAYATFLTESVLAWLPLDLWTPPEIGAFMDQHNIGWVLTQSPVAAEALRRFPALFTPIGAVKDRASLFQVNRDRTFFLAGSGQVKASLNRLELSELSPDAAGRVVIAYHYFSSLRATDGTPLRSRPTELTPFGFIELEKPPAQVTIVNDTTAGFPDFRQDFDRFYRTLLKRLEKSGYQMDVKYGSGFRRIEN